MCVRARICTCALNIYNIYNKNVTFIGSMSLGCGRKLNTAHGKLHLLLFPFIVYNKIIFDIEI